MIQVSIIIPTYKPASYIYECLQSIDNQTLEKSNYELVMVLNGCNEPYKKDLDKFISESLSQDLNITFIQTDQGGVSNARNIGIEQAKGEYITFIDDDDYISTTYIEELLSNASPQVVSLSNTIAFDDESGTHDDNYRISKAFKANRTTTINGARKYFSGPVMKLIHKDIIGERRFNKSFRIGEDSLFMFLLSDRIKKCRFTSEKAIYYRRNRKLSAINTKRKFQEYTKNQLKLSWMCTKIYFGNLFEYNSIFYLTRLLAGIKSWMFIVLKR